MSCKVCCLTPHQVPAVLWCPAPAVTGCPFSTGTGVPLTPLCPRTLPVLLPGPFSTPSSATDRRDLALLALQHDKHKRSQRNSWESETSGLMQQSMWLLSTDIAVLPIHSNIYLKKHLLKGFEDQKVTRVCESVCITPSLHFEDYLCFWTWVMPVSCAILAVITELGHKKVSSSFFFFFSFVPAQQIISCSKICVLPW